MTILFLWELQFYFYENDNDCGDDVFEWVVLTVPLYGDDDDDDYDDDDDLKKVVITGCVAHLLQHVLLIL